MRRVVITGLGIVSCIGNNKEEVLTSLKGQTSGIRYIPEYEEAGFRSHIAGRPQISPDDHIASAFQSVCSGREGGRPLQDTKAA